MMRRPPTDDSRRLPREWLPEPLPANDSPVWDTAAERIMAAVGSELPARRSRPELEETPWWWSLGRLSVPAAGLAIAATTLLLLIPPHGPADTPIPEALPLSVAASNGDPAAFFEGLGITADPVLALVTLRMHGQ